MLLLLSSLTSCDPGSISDTLEGLVTSKVRVSVVCLAAETKLARDLTIKTGGTFGVALNEGHLRDLMWESIPPPALTGEQPNRQPAPGARSNQPASDLMMMGFPTRLPDSGFATLCACHANLKPEGFLCPRCGAKLCDVPTDCDVCGLLVVSSPHLARSYHHLFPVASWAIVCVSLAVTGVTLRHADQAPLCLSQTHSGRRNPACILLRRLLGTLSTRRALRAASWSRPGGRRHRPEPDRTLSLSKVSHRLLRRLRCFVRIRLQGQLFESLIGRVLLVPQRSRGPSRLPWMRIGCCCLKRR